MSMILFNFLGSNILLVHVNASYVSGVLNIVVLFSQRMVCVWLVVNSDSVTSVVNDY